MPLAAHEIDIDDFRQILFLPLTLAPDAAHLPADRIAAFVKQLNAGPGPWRRLRDPLDHAMSGDDLRAADGQGDPLRSLDERRLRYEEFVYFHAFAQKYL